MSKIGEIYKIEYDDGTQRYFQLVAFDMTTLNSDVIAVFNKHSNRQQDTTIEDIINSGVEFFTHTTVNAGIRQELWTKIGKSSIVDYKNALFKTTDHGTEPPEIESYEADSYHSWVIWHVNEEWQSIGGNIEQYPEAELGHVFAPDSIKYRILHGKYDGPSFYGQQR